MKYITSILSVGLLVLGVAGLASAAVSVPEIDAGTGMNAVALLAGAAIVIRARLKK